MRETTTGWALQWQPSTTGRRNPHCPAAATLWRGETEPTDDEWQHISQVCIKLTSDMQTKSGEEVPATFDGTIGGLIRIYQTDKHSPFKRLRTDTRQKYVYQLKKLDDAIGHVKVKTIVADDIIDWQEMFTDNGKHESKAETYMSRLRNIISFGCLKLPRKAGCHDVNEIFTFMRGKGLWIRPYVPRGQMLTFEQTLAVIAKAHDMGFPSVALAQAIQYETALRQKDVIGEWLPRNAEFDSEVIDGTKKWVMGLTWAEIKDNVLTHLPSKGVRLGRKRKRPKIFDLAVCPLIVQEIARMKVRPMRGPVVICELTGLPWRTRSFYNKWREIADAAGLPPDVQNRDTRAGAASEARDAGSARDDVRQHLGHADEATTALYERTQLAVSRRIGKARIASRQKDV